MELAKGKNAIERASGADVIAVLLKLKEAVLAGELGAQIEATSGALRAGFVKLLELALALFVSSNFSKYKNNFRY